MGIPKCGFSLQGCGMAGRGVAFPRREGYSERVKSHSSNYANVHQEVEELHQQA